MCSRRSVNLWCVFEVKAKNASYCTHSSRTRERNYRQIQYDRREDRKLSAEVMLSPAGAQLITTEHKGINSHIYISALGT